jgi:hypothetical protein
MIILRDTGSRTLEAANTGGSLTAGISIALSLSDFCRHHCFFTFAMPIAYALCCLYYLFTPDISTCLLLTGEASWEGMRTCSRSPTVATPRLSLLLPASFHPWNASLCVVLPACKCYLFESMTGELDDSVMVGDSTKF